MAGRMGNAQQNQPPQGLWFGIGRHPDSGEHLLSFRNAIPIEQLLPLKDILRMAHQNFPDLWAEVSSEIVMLNKPPLLGPDGQPLE